MSSRTKEIHNGMDLIDSSDIIARIAWLDDTHGDIRVFEIEEQLEEIAERLEVLNEVLNSPEFREDSEDENREESEEERSDLQNEKSDLEEELEELRKGVNSDDEEIKEYYLLKALEQECEGYASDWQHGTTLIRDTYFETYARELAEDTGAIGRDDPWPIRCIDWDKACDELQMDYTSVDFDGVEYWIRST